MTDSGSVFAERHEEMFERILVGLRFTDRLVGGQPKDPKLVQGWLRKNMGVEDEVELLARTRTHLQEMGVELTANATYEEMVAASEALAEEIQTQGFKRDDQDRPVIEARHVKAGIKESVNILFGTDRWGPTRKGPRGFTAERVFVFPQRIPVGGSDDVKVDLAIGHITGPQGPRSTIGYYEYVEHAEARFEIRQLRAQGAKETDDGKKVGEPALDFDQWSKVFTHMELNGLGAMRSQSHGQFEVVKFEVVGGES